MKTEDGFIVKCRKHFTYVIPSLGSAQLEAKKYELVYLIGDIFRVSLLLSHNGLTTFTITINTLLTHEASKA